MKGIFVIFPIFSIATAQVLSSSLRDGLYFCPGMSKLVFTCEIRGTNRITWKSDEYIETSLVFGRSDRPGSRLDSPVDENVYALLTRNDGEGDSRILVSELHIVPSQNFRKPSVQCVDVERNTNRNISFYIISEDPRIPQDLFAVQIEHFSERCVVTSSWLPPNNTDEAMVTDYAVYTNGSMMDPANITRDGVRVLTLLNVTYCAAHNISVSASSPCSTTSQSSPFQLDPTLRLKIDIPVNDLEPKACNPIKGGTIDKMGSIMMIAAGVVLTATLFH